MVVKPVVLGTFEHLLSEQDVMVMTVLELSVVVTVERGSLNDDHEAPSSYVDKFDVSPDEDASAFEYIGGVDEIPDDVRAKVVTLDETVGGDNNDDGCKDDRVVDSGKDETGIAVAIVVKTPLTVVVRVVDESSCVVI